MFILCVKLNGVGVTHYSKQIRCFCLLSGPSIRARFSHKHQECHDLGLHISCTWWINCTKKNVEMIACEYAAATQIMLNCDTGNITHQTDSHHRPSRTGRDWRKKKSPPSRARSNQRNSFPVTFVALSLCPLSYNTGWRETQTITRSVVAMSCNVTFCTTNWLMPSIAVWELL